MTLIKQIRKHIGELVTSPKAKPQPFASQRTSPQLVPPSPAIGPSLNVSTFAPPPPTPTATAYHAIDIQQHAFQLPPSAYSHGLENVYALQNVDVKTIRRISSPAQAVTPQKESPSLQNSETPAELQLEFDFGEEFSGCMESFLLYEPLKVLNLSTHTEKRLLEHGKHLLHDVVGMHKSSFVFLKGMGQGHIDELQSKLENYINHRPLSKARSVDFGALIRGFVAGLDRCQAFAFLEHYGLHELVHLTASDKAEIRRQSKEQRFNCHKDVKGRLSCDPKQPFYRSKIDTMLKVFIIPWIRQRHSLATEDELMERFQKISDEPDLTPASLALINDIFFPSGGFTGQLLKPVDKHLHCLDLPTLHAYKWIISKAQTYFYTPQISYPLDYFLKLFQSECARDWISFREGFLEKALRLSPHFRIRKFTSDQLHIMRTAGNWSDSPGKTEGI